VRHVRQQLHVSERRTCRVLDQPRRTQRYRQARRPDDEGKLIGRMHELVRRHPRRGYRMIWAMLRGEGWRINRKRVWRLWKREGLKVPQKQVKKRRLGNGSGDGVVRQRAQYKDHVWAVDFTFDRTGDGRSLKWLSIVDEYTRECLALEVNQTMTAADVIDVLIELTRTRGCVPAHVRSDNGPEFVAAAIRRWLGSSGVGTLYIEPGSPWENGYAESFHARLRDELLDAEVFGSVAEARMLATQWRQDYNHRRPHSSLGYVTPAAFAASLAAPSVGAAPLPSEQQAKEQELVILS
jgi:transposase InsO family protein